MVNGNVVAIFIAPTAGGKMEEVTIAEAIAGAGLAGDRYSTGEGSFNRKRPGMLVMRSGLAKRGEIDAVKGCRIAADRGPDLILKYLLRQSGLDIQRDQVEIGPLATDDPNISFGVAAARALADGRVDGLWANALGCELATQLGAGSVIIDPRCGDGPMGAGNYSFARWRQPNPTLKETRTELKRRSGR
jgi:ABC-type nitrate/sulfonate/bicarbonate transport system substrate-binding protein